MLLERNTEWYAAITEQLEEKKIKQTQTFTNK